MFFAITGYSVWAICLILYTTPSVGASAIIAQLSGSSSTGHVFLKLSVNVYTAYTKPRKPATMRVVKRGDIFGRQARTSSDTEANPGDKDVAVGRPIAHGRICSPDFPKAQ